MQHHDTALSQYRSSPIRILKEPNIWQKIILIACGGFSDKAKLCGLKMETHSSHVTRRDKQMKTQPFGGNKTLYK